MLDGFAFLTARIQLKMEAEFPTFTQSLLNMVYPHYAAPTPSMAVVAITPVGRPPRHAGRRGSCRPGPSCAACSAPKTRPTASSAPPTPCTCCRSTSSRPSTSPPPPRSPRSPCPTAPPPRLRSACACAPRATCRSPRSRSSAYRSSSAARTRRPDAALRAAIGARPGRRRPPDRAPAPLAGTPAAHRRPPRPGSSRERGAAPRFAADLRRLPAAPGILRAARAVPVLRHRRPRPRRHPMHRHRARDLVILLDRSEPSARRTRPGPPPAALHARPSTCSPSAATA